MNPTRREFLHASAVATLGFTILPASARSANSRIQLGCIGVNGKVRQDTLSCAEAGAVVIALCDTADPRRSDLPRRKNKKKAGGGEETILDRFPDAKLFTDYREMIASVGGLDIVTNTPSLQKNSHSLSLRVDSFDSYRAALDSSVVLVPGKLGLRVDVLQEDRRRFVEPTKAQRSSAFAALTYRPRPESTITFNAGSSRIRQKIGRSVVAFDQYTPGGAAGSPLKPVYGNTAAATGFEHVEYLSAMFRRECGLSPREFRAKHAPRGEAISDSASPPVRP
jgi:hypothetical protein